MRFFSSSALARAAEVEIGRQLFRCRDHPRAPLPRPIVPRPPTDIGIRRPFRRSSRFGARILTEPPAFSTASTADFEAPNTSKLDLGLELAVAEQPHAVLGAAHQAGLDQGRGIDRRAGVELLGVDRRLDRPRLTSLQLERERWCSKPRLGRRRCSGIWPPSKPLMRTPERAVWPLPPRPPVLPAPEPMPRPMRKRFLPRAVLGGDLVELHVAASLVICRRRRGRDA